MSVAACGGNSASTTGTGSGAGGLRKVVFGAAPVAPTGALQVGIDKGFFKEEGIEVEVKMVQGGAAVLPGVMAGNPQFSTSNATTLLTARDRGLGVKIISHWSSDRKPPQKGMYGVVVPKGSAIKSLTDLQGKKVAVNTLRGLGDFTVGEAVRKAGGNPDKINFVELAFPDMSAALKGGHVNAVWVPEPFLSRLLNDGSGRLVGYTTQESVPGLASYVFTSDRLQNSDPKLVAAVTRALNKTLEYAQDHTAEVQSAAAKITDIPKATLKASGMESFGTDLRKPQLEETAKLMQERGWIKNGPKAAADVLP
ncbi:ABC transporter substrate-binding protein [Streptomyces sp. NBC_01795]|nr:ABC transporter substrate-binding protein [Streptomyces sp. NBC_01795]WSA96936.1 ABC transporter substrate-binding protein [Streptomyces sp. NBC_01795]WSS17885.1 ABC transporter substrate-binding protein [Streptomyces sp. NBC_01186]